MKLNFRTFDIDDDKTWPPEDKQVLFKGQYGDYIVLTLRSDYELNDSGNRELCLYWEPTEENIAEVDGDEWALLGDDPTVEPAAEEGEEG